MLVLDQQELQKHLNDSINISEILGDIILIKRKGKVESALLNIDILEDLLAQQNPDYLKNIKLARKGKAFTPKEVFGDLW